MTPVVIVVPGIMGSELRLGEELIWPGPIASLKLPYNKMAQLMRPDLAATDLIRKVGIFPEYSSLLADLESCGFHEHTSPPTLYPFPYDWRKSNAEAARNLARLIDKAHQAHGGTPEITLIAHSMGGLVSRCYLESGGFKGNPGFGSIRTLITIGTPHRGAALALTAAAGEEKRLFLSKSQVLQLASDTRYPSTYELLPPTGEPFAWGVEADRFQAVNIFDAAPATGIGLIKANLDAAASFHSKLDASKRPAGVRYFCFYGTRQVTSTIVEVRPDGAKLGARARQIQDAGDGTVPVWSGQLPGVQSQPVGGEHGTLFRDGDLRQTLGILLGVEGVLSPVAQFEISLTPKVVETGAAFHVALLFPGGVTEVEGDLTLVRVNTDESGAVTGKVVIGVPQHVHYTGTAIDKIGTTINAPDLAGFYEVAFSDTSAGAEAKDELIVQG